MFELIPNELIKHSTSAAHKHHLTMLNAGIINRCFETHSNGQATRKKLHKLTRVKLVTSTRSVPLQTWSIFRLYRFCERAYFSVVQMKTWASTCVVHDRLERHNEGKVSFYRSQEDSIWKSWPLKTEYILDSIRKESRSDRNHTRRLILLLRCRSYVRSTADIFLWLPVPQFLFCVYPNIP